MDVNQATGIASVHADGRKSGQGREQAPESMEHKDDKNPPSGSWREQAAVHVDGHLADALTPEVQRIIDALNREIEPLRRHLASAEHQIEELNAALVRHRFLEIPNYAGIVHDLEHVISHRQADHLSAVFVMLHVANAERVRQTFGRTGLQAYLRELSRRITEAKQPTDVFGSLGGNDFALILLGADAEGAALNVSALVQQVAGRTVDVAGNNISPELLSATVDLAATSSPETAIREADLKICSARSAL